ncbi:hypothetical protein HPC49_08480 [Pyxidicoccus fallax]|uniref:CARDB domain-containing protein n=1 Tax=Pyxidicoccus fallax TaxID=394095 RepID=A0A848L4H8_9BACT|nr:CARDB domain-containing protein [Pyxidicoccus fallax]NMO13367.1 hypothetical protein [Pyxidicoccus fallax]NPC78285.1 hypothetical protein [Pyxidicoccus fallax]
MTETKQGLGGPDFVVTALRAPPSTPPGSPFEATVTVCNQGDVGIGTEVALVLSDDTSLSISTDTRGGSVHLGYLPAGGCETRSLQVSPAPSAGAWYVGALVDPYGRELESDERNNTRLHGPMSVGYGPDFVVTRVDGPPSAREGQLLSFFATVCNQGTEPGDAPVELSLSTDTVIRPGTGPLDDAPFGRAPSDTLRPGQCQTLPVQGRVQTPFPSSGSAYYVGAVVDPQASRPELREDNNTHAAFRIGVGDAPDFVVTSVTGPASVQRFQPFPVQVTVCNQGTQAGGAQVGLFMSADAVIRPNTGPGPMEDAPAGQASVGFLVPGQCSTLPVQAYAQLPPQGEEGPYHLGAVVDPNGTVSEILEDNNTSSGHRLGVGHRPDFVVTAVKAPASVREGEPHGAQVTVCNQGTAWGDTEVELYMSVDEVIHPRIGQASSEDRLVGRGVSGLLAPSQCTTLAMPGEAGLPYPGTPGAYHLGAVVDPRQWMTELREDNNTSAGQRLGVGDGPDFVVTAVKGPASVREGEPHGAQVTVCNQGTEWGAAEVEVYLSADEHIQPSDNSGPSEDRFVGGAPTDTLAPGQCTTLAVPGSTWLPAPGMPGGYQLGAVVDPRNQRTELREDNNIASGYRIGVGAEPDFIITAVKGPASVQVGQSLTAQVTVCNQGTEPSGTWVELLLSADAILRPNPGGGMVEDLRVGEALVDVLQPGRCATVPVTGLATPPPPGSQGAYYLGAVVDPRGQDLELREDNNIASGYRLGLGTESDFVVTSVTGPFSVQPGSAFSVSVAVCNQGQQGGIADVDVYLSADATVRPTSLAPAEDFPVGTVRGVALSPGQCATRTVSATAPSVVEGAYYLGAVVDPRNDAVELIEDNNVFTGNRIGVGSREDFVVTAVTGPSSVKPGSTFSASVTVCNRGQQAATVDVDVYLSADRVIRPASPPRFVEDFLLGTVAGVSLNAGQCASHALGVTALSWLPEGGYFLGAVADPRLQRAELIEDNNIVTGSRIGVGLRPDFVITGVFAPASVRQGAAFAVNVMVCNQGQAPSTTDVDLFLSADGVIRPPAGSLPPEDLYLGTVTGVSLGVGQCVIRSRMVNANVMTTGAYFVGAVADAAGARQEILEDNNAQPGTIVSVTP